VGGGPIAGPGPAPDCGVVGWALDGAGPGETASGGAGALPPNQRRGSYQGRCGSAGADGAAPSGPNGTSPGAPGAIPNSPLTPPEPLGVRPSRRCSQCGSESRNSLTALTTPITARPNSRTSLNTVLIVVAVSAGLHVWM